MTPTLHFNIAGTDLYRRGRVVVTLAYTSHFPEKAKATAEERREELQWELLCFFSSRKLVEFEGGSALKEMARDAGVLAQRVLFGLDAKALARVTRFYPEIVVKTP